MSNFIGIDVSEHNGRIDWGRVKSSGVNFAILRAGYGRIITQTDDTFERNYNNAKEVGVHVGAYWYCYATTPEDAKKEAAVCLRVLKGKKFDYPIYYDIEEKKTFATGMKNVSDIARAFCETLEDAGYFVGIYSGASAFRTYFDDDVKSRYSIWVAHWGVKKPSYDGNYGIWQRSATGSINGINGNVDLDTSYIDFPTLITSVGKNGYTAPTVTPVTPPKKTMEIRVVSEGVTYTGTVTEV